VKQHDHRTAEFLLHVAANWTKPAHEVTPFSMIDVEDFQRPVTSIVRAIRFSPTGGATIEQHTYETQVFLSACHELAPTNA
jgi:hypothetical protein